MQKAGEALLAVLCNEKVNRLQAGQKRGRARTTREDDSEKGLPKRGGVICSLALHSSLLTVQMTPGSCFAATCVPLKAAVSLFLLGTPHPVSVLSSGRLDLCLCVSLWKTGICCTLLVDETLYHLRARSNLARRGNTVRCHTPRSDLCLCLAPAPPRHGTLIFQ